MKTLLITGGAGFIGSNFINYIISKYHSSVNIINIDKISYAGNLENLSKIELLKNYRFYKANICDQDSLTEIFDNNDIDYIINFAAESHVDRSILNPGVFIHNNVIGTQVLLDTAKKYWQTDNLFADGKKFIQVSTDEVYGSLALEGSFSEETPLDPHSPYSASKASADHTVKSYFYTYKMPVIITRCSNNYGPYQYPEKLIPLVINNALHNKHIPVYGSGKNIRDWLYVEDHCRAIDMILEKGTPGEVYNIGGNNEYSNIDVIRLIINVLKKLVADDIKKIHITESLINFVEDRKGHDFRYAINSTKLQRELGWKPEVSFEEGIIKTVTWYISNSEWLEKVISGEYQNYYSKIYKELR